jgi:hypothetical protein
MTTFANIPDVWRIMRLAQKRPFGIGKRLKFERKIWDAPWALFALFGSHQTKEK